MTSRYDTVVIGGGHAGIEAAHASARLGARTAMVSMDVKAIGRMSCNPAIGGVAKGQLAVGATFRHQSLIGTVFDCRVEGRAAVGPHAGILPSVAGWARVTGYNTILVDSRDPLAHGFEL